MDMSSASSAEELYICSSMPGKNNTMSDLRNDLDGHNINMYVYIYVIHDLSIEMNANSLSII